jgi:hypothetical protein
MEFPPNSDQIELTLFGPGYGECAVVHLGANRWIIIDSCLDSVTQKPAALEYFNRIGISAQEAVRLIVISHWHDDHVRGLSEVVKACPNAHVCYSAVLTHEEFLTYISSYKDLYIQTHYTGVKDIYEILKILESRDFAKRKRAFSNKVILKFPAEEIAPSCVVTSLSPSEKEYELFLQEIAKLIPGKWKTKFRAPSLQPNHTAIALWIEIGSIKILLGSDLEERNDPSTGWSAIVNSEERPEGHASIIKIPHHGSSTAHHDQVWTHMMIQHPFAVLLPYYLADKKLPEHKDIVRIIGLTPKSYITTRNPIPKSKKSRNPAVERTLRENKIKIRAVQPKMGWVSLRNGGRSNPHCWEVKMSPDGCQLSSLI